MATANLASRVLSWSHFENDEYGTDVLRSKIVERIKAIRSYTPKVVSGEERGAPELLSFNAYGSEDYWWCIMIYNGILTYKDLVEGASIGLPDFASLQAVLALSNPSSKQAGPKPRVRI